MADGRSHQRWKLLSDSGSHNSGYRVLEALCQKGLARNEGGYNADVWIKITDAGRAALGSCK